jgi:DNA-binding MarR family transcriptional regulator
LPESRLTRPQGIDDLLLYRLYRLVSVAGAPVIRLCEGAHGITRREWRTIAMLAQHGAMRSSQLAEYALLDRARTSKAVTSLLAKQLITRRPGPGDRRQALLELTERGVALHAVMLPQVRAINAALLSALPVDAVAQLDESLSRLQQQADASSVADTLPHADRHLGRKRPPLSS